MESLRLHTDPGLRASVHVDLGSWLPTPMPGVTRLPLHRLGGEFAQATTLVRYAPGSHFRPHIHDGGEEFIVLEGEFRDEHGVYPAGTYVRNPPGSRHAPSAPSGCLLFVKLRQFEPSDTQSVRHRIGSGAPVPLAGCPGVRRELLHASPHERVHIETWPPGRWMDIGFPGGGEVLVLEGGYADDTGVFRRHDWQRLPAGTRWQARASADGAQVWIKRGHLEVLST